MIHPDTALQFINEKIQAMDPLYQHVLEERMDSILNCYYPLHGKINGEIQQIKAGSPKVAYPF